MRVILTAMLTALPLTLVAGTAANASETWRQSCAGADYVCGSQVKSSKAVKLPSGKTKKGIVASSENRKIAPKKYAASASKPKGKVATDYSGGGSFQAGKASWYGSDFHGRKTANGETYNMNALTAAHRSLPFGTRVRVTNTRSGSSVVVRINDRGPFIGGRIIDLSRAAASQIGLTNSGVASVKVAVLGKS